MSHLKEAYILKEEEKILINLHTKLSDQLNRLKVEELALITMIRLETGGNTSTESEQFTSNKNKDFIKEENESTQEELHLSVQAERLIETGELEEEEEEEDSEDEAGKELMSFLEELSAHKI